MSGKSGTERAGNNGGEKITGDADTCPVTFTVAEIWTLHDFVRHEMQGQDTWKFPPVSRGLNEEIATALVNCVDLKLSEWTFLLSIGDLLVIDYLVRHDFMSPEGARGDAILLKTFRARQALSYGGYRIEGGVTEDVTYSDALKATRQTEEVNEDAQPSDQPDDSPDADPDGDAGSVPTA